MEDRNKNDLKQENYREQMVRLKRAIDQQFYLEAIFIEYSIMEDRTEAILRHAKEWEKYEAKQKGKGRYPTIESKIKKIMDLAREKKSPLHRYFGDQTLNNVLQWKDQRNTLIHALLKQNLQTEDLLELAQNGQELAKLLRNRVNDYKRALARLTKRNIQIKETI